MDRPVSRLFCCCVLAVVAVAPLSIGCHPGLLMATGIYMWEGGNLAPAECELLEQKRVAVFCRPPAATEFRHAGASRQLAQRVGMMLRENVKKIDVVPQRKVDEWLDENDTEDFEELARAVKADLVVQIELGHFDLYSGKTVYKGSSAVQVFVNDMKDDGAIVYEKDLGEVLFPVHGDVPIQDKPVTQFQREYVAVVAQRISHLFYAHDPYADFALDATAVK
ncbi:hypothetical protein [Botrimarina sp.]|uniref:hypothetical protein n=1 Tax=Botrimarina sp. TaxID=2795802 RepID=UPI0032EAC0C0